MEEYNHIRGEGREGTCAECAENRIVQIQRRDIEAAAAEMLAVHGEPATVYRYCDSCGTSDASILIH